MTHNKIKVLFFSKKSNLSEAIQSLFSDEVDFIFEQLARLDDLCFSKLNNTDSLIILDLSNSADHFAAIVDKKGNDFIFKSIIFLLDNNQKIDYIYDKNSISLQILYKPFRVDELFSKIRSLATNLGQFDESVVIMHSNYFYQKQNLIKNNKGNLIRLTEKETEIIKFLNNQKGKILSKDVLLKTIWGYEKSITTHTLETHIYRLRKKIRAGLGETELILKNDKGYYLNSTEAKN